jgi:hypothetical protein
MLVSDLQQVDGFCANPSNKIDQYDINKILLNEEL